MKKKYLLNHLKPGVRTLSVLVTLLVTAMTLLPQSVWGQTTYYDLWVNGIQVTDGNMSDVTGDENNDGAPQVTYDPSTSTLTLDNATLTGTDINHAGILSGLSALTISIKGTNTIEINDTCSAIRATAEGNQTLTIVKGSDNCSLTLQCYRPIRDFNTLTLNGVHWEWGTNYTYGTSNFGYGNGYGLMDVTGGEASKVILNDVALDPPSMYVEDNNVLGFENVGSNKIFYTIDYVDSSLDDIEETELNVQEPFVTLSGPCTVTAYAQNGDFKSTAITGKLFGFVVSEVSGVPGTEIDIPAIVPAIESTDGIEFAYEGTVQPDATLTKIDLTDVTCGNYFLQLYINEGQTEPPYTILNMYVELSVKVIPPAPTIVTETVELDTDQITITKDESLTDDINATIYYAWDDGDFINYVDPVAARSGVLHAKVGYNVDNDVFYSEEVTQEYTVKKNIDQLYIPEFVTTVTYTGKAITPDFQVMVSEKEQDVIASTNYIVSYRSQDGANVEQIVDAGTYVVTITGTGDTYGGSKTVTREFTVTPADLSDVTIEEIEDQAYTGSAIEPAVTVKLGNVTITADQYNVAYSNNVDVGEATVTLTFNSGNFTTNSPALIKTTSFQIFADLIIGGVPVTDSNRTNVMGDQDEPTVQFDGQNTLILNNYVSETSGIVIGGNYDVSKGLIIYLKGENHITSSDYLINNQISGANFSVTFQTNELVPGNLVYDYTGVARSISQVSDAFYGCANIVYDNSLSSSISGQTVSISMAADLTPIVDSSNQEETVDGDEGRGLGEDIEEKGDPESPSALEVIVNKILYTLTESDGYLLDGSNKVVALNSSSTVPDALPGTEDFAANFKGMTFLLPAGSGEIVVEALTGGNSVLNVQIGDQTPTQFSGLEEFTECKVLYAVTVPTYVYIYKTGPAASRSLDIHRAPGRKETATVEIKGLSVSASSVVDVPEPAVTPVLLEKSAVAKVTGEHFIKVNNPNVAGVDADAFEGVKKDDELTYVDLTETGIKGITVDRSTDAFKDVPAKAFIYLPAGNKVKAGTKNVIIGSVCENMEMADDAPYFEMAQDFTALNVKQNRDYSDFVDKNCTVYLPFAIDEETAATLGTFYELKGYDGTTVVMESVKETKANTPYMFKPKAADTKVAAKMVKVEATPAAAPVAGTIKFVGTYKQMDIVSDASTQYYCFMADGVEAGKFVHVITNPVTMNPYRAYMVVEGAAARELDLVIDGVSTGIKNMKVGTDDNVYYDMQGRRVLYPTKGLYIVNGHKVIIK
ncbi:MAG: hypothetical protein J5952_00535 [Prevotella sp.]|nr:hypothetical protein [Prevotella sp.]